jgi:hypothetical protein
MYYSRDLLKKGQFPEDVEFCFDIAWTSLGLLLNPASGRASALRVHARPAIDAIPCFLFS